MRYGLLKWTVIAGAVLVLGWGDIGAEWPADAVAKVGTRLIVEADLHAAALRLRDKRWGELEEGAREEVLQAVVAAELLALEGRRRGLDRDPELVAELAALRRKLLAEEYFARVVWADTTIGEAAIEQRYRAWGLGEQLHLAHILVADEKRADETLASLAGGAAFAELARTHSRHAASAHRGGDMGYLRRDMLLPEIAAAVWGAPVGQLYPKPIKTRMGYHVVFVVARHRQALPEQRPVIRRRLVAEKKLKLQREFWREMAGEYQVQWRGHVADRMARRQPLPAQQDLYTWRGGSLPASAYLRRADVAQPVFADTARIRQLAERMVLEELACQQAAALGYDSLAAVQARLENERNERMAGLLFTAEVTRPTAEELEAFYQRNRDRYEQELEEVAQRVVDDYATVRMDAFIADLWVQYAEAITIVRSWAGWQK